MSREEIRFVATYIVWSLFSLTVSQQCMPLYLIPNVIHSDKMNLTVRLGKLLYENSTGVPALLPCSQLPRQASGALRKSFT